MDFLVFYVISMLFQLIWLLDQAGLILLALEVVKNVIDIVQSLVIIVATIFTAQWTYKTFSHKEKMKELKELKSLIIHYYHQVQIFCAQIRENEMPDEQEISEKLQLIPLHNKLARLKELNLYTKPEVRAKIQSIVGKWLTDSDRIKAMQSRKTQKEREKAWKEFEQEYKEVKKLIDTEANKLI